MRTREEINDLKRDWQQDSSWDIEETPGFEDHHAELLAFRLKIEAEQEGLSQQQLRDKAEQLNIPDNLALASYILGLEFRLNQLERKLGPPR